MCKLLQVNPHPLLLHYATMTRITKQLPSYLFYGDMAKCYGGMNKVWPNNYFEGVTKIF